MLNLPFEPSLGCQVSPLEIEQVLLSHEDVQDAAVVGLPDRLAGELPTAFVVTKSGKTISLSDMQKFASSKHDVDLTYN